MNNYTGATIGVKGIFNQWKEISMRWWNEGQTKLKSIGTACHKKTNYLHIEFAKFLPKPAA